jgi:cytochrome P450
VSQTSIAYPMPPMAPDDVGGWQVLSALRHNAYSAFPRRCLDEPIVKFRTMGRHLILACSPEAVRHVLITHADHYTRLPFGRRVLRPIAGKGILTSEGDVWRQQRRILAPAFTPRSVALMAPHIIRCAEMAGDRWQESCGTEANMLREMQNLGLDIAAATMFSMRASTFASDLRGMMSEYAETMGRLFPVDVLLPDGIPTPLRVRRVLFRRRWKALIRGIINERRKAGPTGAFRDLFDTLSAIYGPDDESLLVDEVSTLLVAGHETTAVVLFWICVLLARMPKWQAALASEVAGIDLSPERAAENIPKLILAHAIVKEALRLYPPAFLTGRLAGTTQEICGSRIEKGAIVLVPIWLLHRNPRWWTQPMAFDPGRFLRDEEPGRLTYLPFGAGPHVCIGAQLAMSEATLVTARLVQRFVIGIKSDRPVLPVGTLSTQPDHAPAFVLQRRQYIGAT